MVNTIINTDVSSATTDLNAEGDGSNSFVASVDVGTTNIRCHIYDHRGQIRGSARRRIELLYPRTGWVEIDPESIWQSFFQVVREAVHSSGLNVREITCLGISTQRATFVTWNRKTSKPYHNFITWQDLRAEELVQQWNNSWTMRLLRFGSTFLHFLTRKKRFLAASVLTFNTRQVVMRLLWALQYVPGLRQGVDRGEVAFGMIESWLLWNLTGGRDHASDYSCISATAMFDPFQLEWGEWMLNLLNIPISIFPQVKNTSGLFGYCEPSHFGSSIPITAIVADQQAAMFGECCFQPGDVKCTLGSGSFLDVNTGTKPHASTNGVYPIIGWKFNSQIIYIAEGSSNDTGVTINWLQNVDLLDDVSLSSEIANSVNDSGGVYFVPAFSGLQTPINDNSACAGFLGISPSTEKGHLVRAVLESLIFRIKQVFDVMESETSFTLGELHVDGGVANCDFIVQLLANVTRRSVIRPRDIDTSCLGAAFLAGLSAGIWKNMDELKKLPRERNTFYPQNGISMDAYTKWEKAIQRCTRWY